MRQAILAISFVAACGSSPKTSTVNNAGTGEPATWTPTTPCVDTNKDAASRIATHLSMSPDVAESATRGLRPSASPDLDGDGAPDAIYAFAPEDVPYTLIYVMRGSCGHFVGDTTGQVAVGTTRTRGWADLAVTDASAQEAAGLSAPVKHTTLTFDGAAYH